MGTNERRDPIEHELLEDLAAEGLIELDHVGEKEIEDLVAKGLIEFDHIDANGQKIYVFTGVRQLALMTRSKRSELIEKELEDLAPQGFICFDHIDEKGQKIYVLTEKGQITFMSKDEPSTTDESSDLIKRELVEGNGQKIDVFTEMGRIARMTEDERIALFEKAAEELVEKGLARVARVNERGEKVYVITKAGRLQAETRRQVETKH